MSENKTSKYLKYALGEVILVVIGILIALQINTWNNNRINKSKELDYLKGFKQELLANKNRLLEKHEKRLEFTAVGRAFIDKMKKNTVTYMDFCELLQTNPYIGMTNLSYGVHTALLSSGDINLINNDSLKFLITDWREQAENVHENESIVWDFGSEWGLQTTAISPHYDAFCNVEKPEESREVFNTLMNSVVFKSQLDGLVGAHEHAVDVVNDILKHLDQMVGLIDDYIK